MRSTVHLTGRYAPGDKDWHQGDIHESKIGVSVTDSHGTYFYPWCKVERIDVRN